MPKHFPNRFGGVAQSFSTLRDDIANHSAVWVSAMVILVQTKAANNFAAGLFYDSPAILVTNKHI
ncbi:hypothetical protein SDC9_127374 [bioreactor metagenome]|uniref:Serine protease n=1 Tax=bioreactor metagenome TaxID=1076179 RepID=A0A645CTS8_9ZZZZ